MTAHKLTDAEWDALTEAVSRSLDGPCFCWLGRPCTRAQAFERTLTDLLGATATDGRPTLYHWAVWREFPAIFRSRESYQ